MSQKTSPRFQPDHFSEHFVGVYEFVKLAGIPAEILTWRRPGTVCGYIRFIRVGHELFVSGDYDNASYSWPSTQTLAWMANTDFQYFHGKCSSSRNGVPAEVWDSDCFTRAGIGEVKMAIENRWGEPEEEIPDDHPMLQAWCAINKSHGPSDAQGVQSFIEQDVPREIHKKVPIKYRDGAPAAAHYDHVGEFFFGAHWPEYIPSGLVASHDCVTHHGALRMAVQWLQDNDPLLWKRVQKEIEEG